MPREIVIGGAAYHTGIYKAPVGGPVRLAALGLDGDVQVDRRVHGGVDKAVYFYPHEHYAAWRAELGIEATALGEFGENLTVAGGLETDVHLGDVFRIGGVTLQVTTPRQPCVKIATKIGRADFPKQMIASARLGYYARVLEEGEVSAGDRGELIDPDPERLTVRDAIVLYYVMRDHRDGAEKILRVRRLPDGWREEFERRLRAGGGDE